MEYFNELSEIINEFLMSLGVLAPIFSSILIILEGILAFLPLFMFITINVLVLGPIFGGLISWICTTFGSFLTFYFCRKGLHDFFQKKIKNRKLISKYNNLIDNLSFVKLVLFVAIPFMPSFFINLGAGLSNIPIKKYLCALLLGKVFIVVFWGYIGTSLISCLTNPIEFIKVVVLVVVAYVIAKIVDKKFDLDKRFM
jgi:uncharacterized membrane protein YdjX (TVP38/TMEM64 family)